VPTLILIGDLDDWSPAADCQKMMAQRSGDGAPLRLVVYPGAYHAFDAPNQPRLELPNYRTRTGVVPVIGTDPAARQDALARIPAFLAR